MKLAEVEGRITLVLTPELRQLALDQLHLSNSGDDDLIAWFQEQETPDGHVLDAATNAADCLMIEVILKAVLDMHTDVVTVDVCADEHVRTISRY